MCTHNQHFNHNKLGERLLRRNRNSKMYVLTMNILIMTNSGKDCCAGTETAKMCTHMNQHFNHNKIRGRLLCKNRNSKMYTHNQHFNHDKLGGKTVARTRNSKMCTHMNQHFNHNKLGERLLRRNRNSKNVYPQSAF